MAPEVGLEPTTNRLTADRSTTELLRNLAQIASKSYRPQGINPFAAATLTPKRNIGQFVRAGYSLAFPLVDVFC